MSDDENYRAVVMVKKPECLRCKHLAPDLGVRAYNCYRDRNCPAKGYRIVVGVDVAAYSHRLARAWSNNEADIVQQIMSTLAGVDPAIRSKVMSIAKTKMGNI